MAQGEVLKEGAATLTYLFPGVKEGAVDERKRIRLLGQLLVAHAPSMPGAIIRAHGALARIPGETIKASARSCRCITQTTIAAFSARVCFVLRRGDVRPREPSWAHAWCSKIGE